MPKAYILIGVPGSGKSTWVNNQEWKNDCAYISTDQYVEKYALREGKTYTEVFQEYMPTAVDLMAAAVVEARTKNQDVIWEQTSTSVESRKKKFRMLPNYYHIAVMFKTPAISELQQRLANRPGKTIPWEVVLNMIDQFEIPTEKEGFKEIWHVN
jgi:predicted kinase